jgi:lipopolysaccharide export system protein LptA
MPQILRAVVIAAIAVTVFVVVVGFYRERSTTSFKLKGEHAQLSKDVVAEVNGYERLESDNGINKYYIKADHAKTFADKHQELDNVYLEAYDTTGTASNKMTAESAIYIPEEDKNFTAYLKGNVNIETTDSLKIKTEHITYTRKNETAEADEAIEFERENVKGKSFGATVRMAEKRLELLRDVEIETFESPELSKSNIRYAKINAGYASLDQIAGKIDLDREVAINIISKVTGSGAARTTDLKSNRALAFFKTAEGKDPQISRFEMFENVRIASTDSGQVPTNVESGYAMYDKDADRFELKGGVRISTTANDKATDIRASEAVFEQSAHKVALTGGGEITQGGDYLKGDSIYADLFPGNSVKEAVVRGDGLARQVSPERTMTISAPELNAAFSESRSLRSANAIGQSTAELIPADANAYTRVVLNSVRGIGLSFKGEGLLDAMRTDGRTTINLSVPNNKADAANKRVTADAVKTTFAANGKDIIRAEAVGNAELFVEPLNAGVRNYRTTVNAPRFDCEFFPTGNNARSCVGGRKAKALRVPSIRAAGRGNQTLTADQLTARFNETSKDVEVLDASGSAKFVELDRNAIAHQMAFTQADEVVRLRGGEPTVWDSRARAKAGEIDWDTRKNRSYLRGGVRTTYYSRMQMKDSTPFAASDKPVFATSSQAEFDHAAETALYTGNARAWQEANYVRCDRLSIDQVAGKIFADGNVQSLLYNAKMKQRGKESIVTVTASAGSMAYDRDKRLLQYRTNVDIRQGTDRLTAGMADVYLSEVNEVSRTVAETNVVITQPGRKATGDWAQYTALDESAIIRGNPATVNDAENGSTQSGELTVNMRDNRVVSEGKVKQNTSGRIRSVYKTKPNQ